MLGDLNKIDILFFAILILLLIASIIIGISNAFGLCFYNAEFIDSILKFAGFWVTGYLAHRVVYLRLNKKEDK